MAVNYTEDGNTTTGLNLQASPLPASIAVLFSALNIFLSITASLGNALILVVLHKVSSIHPPTKLLFRCLAVTDLCVGLLSQPIFAVRRLNAVTKFTDSNILYFLLVVNNASSFILCQVSILTSTCISVDRLLALLLGLRYRLVVTLNRVRAVLVCFWVFSVSVGLLYGFVGLRIAFPAFLVFVTLSLVISVCCYTKIFIELRQHQVEAQDHAVHQGQPNGGGIPLNIARYKKTVSSIAWVQLALVACYVPFIIYVEIITIYGWNGVGAGIAGISAGTLIYLNSSLNPFLYCWKIKEVRQAARNTIKQLLCCLAS